MLRSLVGSEMCIRDRCPGGPLKLLLQAAHDRNEPIPGFIYDSDHKADALLRDDHAGKKTTRNLNMSTKSSSSSKKGKDSSCLLYTSDAADEEDSVELGGSR
eukprot:TRINITY_DN58437_c0_g1_i1.p1 TRINITY_DN58437_c0_g1~~TRINITY_DN58437_c0_g1_i1.p1  ORF type:complete len:102 (+),score=28.50 TRINITY_DN58437_c0_g1_i1:57-362(+)